MRKLLISVLLAGAAATPALAVPDNWHSNRPQRDDNAQSNARSERHQSDNGALQSQPNDSSHNQSNDAPRGRSFGGGGSGGGGGNNDVSTVRVEHNPSDGVRNWRAGGGQQMSGNPAVEQGQQNSGQNHIGWRNRIVESGSTDTTNSGGGRHIRVIENRTSDEGTQPTSGNRRDFWQRRTHVISSGDQAAPGGLVQPERPLPRLLRGAIPAISNTPREGTQPPLRTEGRRTTSHVAWNHNWRHDRRYDWWNWRRTHRSHFHLGLYYDPFGWGYSPFSIGWRMWPSYYSNRYWINDPWELRLPYAPPGYRWIRYYDDAILIDTWDGQVVDVIYNFFW